MNAKGILKITLNVAVVLLLITSCSSDDESNNEQPQNNLNALQGNWFRVGGDNIHKYGMMVNVNTNSGKIQLPQQSGFLVNDLKWKDIVAQNATTYSFQELGTDYNYSSSTMVLTSDDTLRISVNASGSATIQKWVRILTENHDCTPYNAASFGDGIVNQWNEPNENDIYPGFVPSNGQPGGGIYTVTLTNESGIVPGLTIQSANDQSGAISNGSSAGTSNPTERSISFIGHPGVSYSVEALYSSFVISPSPTVNYNLTWSFEGRMDCYEPNDLPSQAKRIPKNQTIEAYALTGYINNSVNTDEPQNNDYYKVRLESTSKLRVELKQVPSSVNLNVQLLNENGSQILAPIEEISGPVSNNGALYNITSESALPAGNYIIRIYIGGDRETVISSNDPTPEHWTMPYKFKARAVQ
jgi:hypothetical protein